MEWKQLDKELEILGIDPASFQIRDFLEPVAWAVS